MTQMEQFQRECRTFWKRISPDAEKLLVFGEGPIERPALMLVGEAPGEQEEIQGRPFVGKAGKNLDAFLEAVHLKREEIYVSNVVKIRPSKVSASGRIVNRPPSKEEKALFTPWLMREISIVRPRAIVTLGNVALQAFVDDIIGKRHGCWSRAVVCSEENESFELPLFALYHPASVIYNGSLKAIYAEDIRKLASTLREYTSV